MAYAQEKLQKNNLLLLSPRIKEKRASRKNRDVKEDDIPPREMQKHDQTLHIQTQDPRRARKGENQEEKTSKQWESTEHKKRKEKTKRLATNSQRTSGL